MAWAIEDAKRYLDAPEGDYIRVEKPTFANRMDADVGQHQRPSSCITFRRY